MAKKRKSVPEPEPESDSSSSSSSGSSGEYELIEEEVEVTDSDSDSSSSSESESEPESEKKNEKSSNGADDDESTDREAIRRLVEPFSKEQLMALLAEAAMRNPEVLSTIASSAQSDPEHRKIFVHGLSYDAKTEDLEAAFSQFGPIQEVKAVCDKNTGRCKGYGFVLFQKRIDAQKALKEPQKSIGERAVSCQLASRGPQQKPKHQATVVNVGTDVQQAGNLGFLGAFNHLAGLGLLNQTGAPGMSSSLAGLGLLNQTGAPGMSSSLAGLGLLNQTGAPGPSNPLAGLGLLNQTGVLPRNDAGQRNLQFQRFF